MRTLCLLIATLAAAPAAAPLAAAEQALREKKPEEVFFALDGATFAPGEERSRAAALLGGAATQALDAADATLAVQLCQTSLRLEASRADTLAVCSAAALAAQLYDAADDYAAKLSAAHPADPRGPLAAARASAAQAEWAKVIERTGALLVKAPPAPIAKEAARLKADAQRELDARKAALSESAELTAKLEAATAKARAMPTGPAGETQVFVASSGVVLYGTSWCGACKAARAWLDAHHVPFTSRDVEADPMAAVELATKAAARGLTVRGVPVIDVGGDLQLGFEPNALARATKKAGLTK